MTTIQEISLKKPILMLFQYVLDVKHTKNKSSELEVMHKKA